MFLNDPFRILRRHVAIPRTFRIHDADRPARADPQALTFRSIERPVGSRKVELFQPLLQVAPRLLAALEVGAIGAETYKKVTRQLTDAECRRCELG